METISQIVTRDSHSETHEAPSFLQDRTLGQAGTVFLVHNNPFARDHARPWLEAEGHIVHEFALHPDFLRTIDRLSPHVVCFFASSTDKSHLSLLQNLTQAQRDLPVLFVDTTEHTVGGSAPLAIFDALTLPLERTRLLSTMLNAIKQARLLRQLTHLKREVQRRKSFEEIVGSSPVMRALYDQITKVADSTIPIFIQGESGTGKELIARAIHDTGSRRRGPFVALNCAAIAESLQESELFGHERGAFTGALATHKGKFEQAHGGTLFLDEIGEISPSVQARLLRVLQDGSLHRVGGSQAVRVDVRVVSATHRDIEAMVKANTFREDLFYRIVVYPIRLPPLRERRDDVPQLLLHFLRKHAAEGGGGVKAIAPEALDLLCDHSWPGNIRELENIVRRAILISDSEVIGLEALPTALRNRVSSSAGNAPRWDALFGSPSVNSIMPLAELERRAILHALTITRGNIAVAAERLGLGRATLYRKLAALRAGSSNELASALPEALSATKESELSSKSETRLERRRRENLLRARAGI